MSYKIGCTLINKSGNIIKITSINKDKTYNVMNETGIYYSISETAIKNFYTIHILEILKNL